MAWKLLTPSSRYNSGNDVASMAWGARNLISTHRRERHECHCMLFLPEEHGFAGDSDHIDLPEVEELTANFKPPPQ